MILGTNLEGLCSLAIDAKEFQRLIQNKIKAELKEEEFQSRISFLNENYSTEKNCLIILKLL